MTSEAGDLKGFSISGEEKKLLFIIARESIRAALEGRRYLLPAESELPPKLKNNLGAFVTLRTDGELRGCIGRFTSSEPLYRVIRMSALSSAFEDPRFSSIAKSDLEKLEIEITVLGPLRKINDISEIIIGKHGILVQKDNRSGTLLPQVATERGWNREEFLGYASRDKARIGWDGWKDADISIFEGIVLEED